MGWDRGCLGRVSCCGGSDHLLRPSDLCGCGPKARPALDFTSSLAGTQATLSPILQARPGFLSHRPHPAQEIGRALWRPPQKCRSFLEQEWAGFPGLLGGLWPLTSRTPAICFPAEALAEVPLGFSPMSSQLQTRLSRDPPPTLHEQSDHCLPQLWAEGQSHF